jgi:hypothetical protein
MSPDERAQMYALCAKVADEKDPAKFTQLVVQLKELLDRKSNA